MAGTALKDLEYKLDELISLCEQLDRENRILKNDAQQWRIEREALVEKNTAASNKVDAMIQRLRALEHEQ